MGRYNTHCHTVYSDGTKSIADMAKEHKKLGYDSLVITDHLYSRKIFMTKESFLQQWEEIKEVSEELNYPIIQGIELNLFYEEVLVFNREIILELFDIVDKYINVPDDSDKLIQKLLKVIAFLQKNKDKCGIILCHPSLRLKEPKLKKYYDSLFSILDGYEKFNHGRDWFKNRFIPEELLNKKQFFNSDAHDFFCIDTGENHSEETIDSEEKLIVEIKK